MKGPAAIVRGWLAQAAQHRARKGAFLFRAGERPQGFVYVWEGVVCVRRLTLDGRELVLYRVRAGETCMFTTLGLLSGSSYPADGVVEEDARFALVPPATFEAWLGEPLFRRFAFGELDRRLRALLGLVEDVAYRPASRRLAERLLALADASGELRATHQALAEEIGAARESVSRALKSFERKGWVMLGRGHLRILNEEALRRFAEDGF